MSANPDGRRMLRLEVRNAETPIERKPEWIKTRAKMGPEFRELQQLVKSEDLHTVCQEAGCPNIFECWEDREATFLIGGSQCTRRCDFCQIDTGKPADYDIDEPRRVAESVARMQLRYSTVTGVARDDLPDEGAWLYAETIREIHRQSPGTGVEILVPDFSGTPELLGEVFSARPQVFAHNVETVPRIFKRIRPAFRYERSLDVITHFLVNAHGADFINVDGRITTRDQGLITDPFTATQFFSDVTDWIQERTTLPVWWSELHTSDGGMGWSLAQQDAVTTVAIGNLAEAQAAVALLWQPQANGLECEGCLWSDPTISIAQPTPLSATAAAWTRCVPAGSVWTGNTSTDPVQLYRSSSEHGTFLVNQTGATLPVLGDGGILELAPYEVRVDPATEDCFR
mgnify:CR=1 FL=1